jgi:acyl-CoA synthetase (AMP-forming)/AMP-acid ligase II
MPYEEMLGGKARTSLSPPSRWIWTPPHHHVHRGHHGKAQGRGAQPGRQLLERHQPATGHGVQFSDRDLLVLPMFHIGGIGLFTLPMLYVGGTVVIQRTFDPWRPCAFWSRKDITLFFGVPAIFLFLIQHPEFKADVFKRCGWS